MALDFLILYEHTVREYESDLLLKLELERRGYTVRIRQLLDAKDLRLFGKDKPEVLVASCMYDNEAINSHVYNNIGKCNKIVNLHWEQMLSDTQEEGDWFNMNGNAKRCVQTCWGKRTAARLQAHGMDARKKLTIDECLTYLTLVTEYAKEVMKAKRVYNYSSSFGGYLTLRYLIEKGDPFTKIALRCPAVCMYQSMMSYLSEDDKNKLRKGKEISVGFERKMKVDQSFFDSLKSFDVMKHEYFDFADSMLIIHGTKDEMIPIEESRRFAENNVIEFIPVEGANHPFQNPDHMALAIHKIIEFFHG